MTEGVAWKHFLPYPDELVNEALDGLRPAPLLPKGPGTDVCGPDQGEEPLVGVHLDVQALHYLDRRGFFSFFL